MKPWTDAEYHKYFKAVSDAIIKRWRLEREEKEAKCAKIAKAS